MSLLFKRSILEELLGPAAPEFTEQLGTVFPKEAFGEGQRCNNISTTVIKVAKFG